MQQHNAALIQASNFTVRACVRSGCSSLLLELARCSRAPLCLNWDFICVFIFLKNRLLFYFSGVTVWWNFCLSVSFRAHLPLTFRGRSHFFLHSDADLLLSPFAPSTTPSIGPLLPAGGLARRQAAPLSLSPPSKLTRCQLGCSSPRGLQLANGRRSTLCLPLSGNPPWCPHT